MSRIKSLINKIFNVFGFEVHQVKGMSIRNSLNQSYKHLAKMGFNPTTVIDVGIAKGTPELYNNFPNSYFLLIEPLEEFEQKMKKILKKYKGEYILAAAGDKEKKVEFFVHKNHLSGSSLYKETMGSLADGEKRIVKLIKVDKEIETRNLKGPYLLKIDVQGAELDVLEGCKGILKETEVIVLEVSMFQFMKGAPEFYDVIFYMKKIGFVAYDIDLAWNRPLDNALGQVNIVFVKENGIFRKDHSFATQTQLQSIFK